MIREIGSLYDEIKFVEEKVYIKIDGVDYAVEGEWLKFTYKVTKKGDIIVDVKLATTEEIEQVNEIDLFEVIDKNIQENFEEAKKEWGKFKNNVKNKWIEVKEKISNKIK